MFRFIKNIIKIISGERVLMSVDKKSLRPIFLNELNDFELINGYQNLSIKSNAYIEEFIQRKFSKEFTLSPRDFEEEMLLFRKDLKLFLNNELEKENYEQANLFKNKVNQLDGLISDIRKNRRYITNIK